MKTELKLLRVNWLDTASMAGWRSLEEMRKDANLAKCISVGFEILRTKECLTLCMSYAFHDADDDEEFSDCITIPVACIVSEEKCRASAT